MNETISILLGAIAGYILPYVVKLITFIIRRSKNTPICGEWFTYLWWTKNNTVELAKIHTSIKRGVFSEYRTTMFDKYSKYIGNAYIEDNNLCIELSMYLKFSYYMVLLFSSTLFNNKITII